MRRLGVIAALTAVTAVVLLADRGTEAAAPEPDGLGLGVVAIDARIGDDRVLSSGTIVDERAGLVVTTVHGVWGATSLRLTTGLGILHGRLVARAPCAGLAVVEIQPRIPGLAALPVGRGATNELLTAVGRREGALASIPVRAVGSARIARVEPGLPTLEGAVRLDGTVPEQAAGGPLLNADGGVVGMTAGGALAIPWETVEQRLGELEVDERRIYVGWRRYYRCAPQLHAHATREHPGYRASDAVINAPVPATRLPGTRALDDR